MSDMISVNKGNWNMSVVLISSQQALNLPGLIFKVFYWIITQLLSALVEGEKTIFCLHVMISLSELKERHGETIKWRLFITSLLQRKLLD